MRLDALSLYKIRMPLKQPWRTAYGSDDVIYSIVVKARSGDHVGWGESSPLRFPTYSPECAESVFYLGKELIAPALIGKDIASGADLGQQLKWIKGNPFAKAGFDLAWWDLAAIMTRKPLWKLIGGSRRRIIAGADFGIQDSFDILLGKIEDAVKRGFPRIKLKFGPGWEMDMLETVRKAFPAQVFHIDCNSAYTLDDLPMFKEIDKFNLAMIEQPLTHDDLLDHAELQKNIKTPICLDESVSSPTKARQAIQIKACRWINVKPARVGGITNALAINAMAEAANIPCWIGGMLESSIGLGHLLALSSLNNIQYPSDVFPSEHFYAKDITENPLEYSECPFFEMPEQPGIGFQPNPELLKAATVEEFSL